MPREAHTTADYHHEKPAKSHRAAAQQSSVGAHEASRHAVAALDHSKKAGAATPSGLWP